MAFPPSPAPTMAIRPAWSNRDAGPNGTLVDGPNRLFQPRAQQTGVRDGERLHRRRSGGRIPHAMRRDHRVRHRLGAQHPDAGCDRPAQRHPLRDGARRTGRRAHGGRLCPRLRRPRRDLLLHRTGRGERHRRPDRGALLRHAGAAHHRPDLDEIRRSRNGHGARRARSARHAALGVEERLSHPLRAAGDRRADPRRGGCADAADRSGQRGGADRPAAHAGRAPGDLRQFRAAAAAAAHAVRCRTRRTRRARRRGEAADAVARFRRAPRRVRRCTSCSISASP